MPDEQHAAAVFSSVEADRVEPDFTISRLAVAALVLGLASVLAVFSPLLWIVAVAAIATAIGSLWAIARSDVKLLGRKAALIGLGLGFLFLGWGVTELLVRERLVFAQAQTHTQQWLELVRQGKLRMAHQLAMHQDQRAAPNADLEEMYKANPEAEEGFEGLFNPEPMASVVKLGNRGTLRFVGNESIRVDMDASRRSEIVVQSYAIDYDQDGQPRTLPLWIEIVRTYLHEKNETRWYIRDVMKPSA